MFNLKNALLWAVPAVCLAFSTVAGENKHSLVPYTYHSTNLELKPSPISKGYQLAAATFLPEFKDSEFGWIVTRPDGPNVDFCRDYPLTSCPDNAECSDCPTNKSYHKLLRCKNGFQNQGNSCIASTCQASGYEASVPTNQICTKITQGGLTCYKDCRSISCAGYTLDCDNFNVSNSNSKETCPDCSSSGSNCSPKLCKVSSCQNGYKIADNGTTCVALDDTCPNGYYNECETGTEGDPEYTEKGTACYMCKAKVEPVMLPILYSDLTTSTEVISGKTPIGVVFDEEKKLAVALMDDSGKTWMSSFEDIPDLPNLTSDAIAIADWNGKNNTKAIINYCKANSVSYPAAKYANSFTTSGTSAGDWYLPALGELNAIYNGKAAINATMAKIGGTALAENYYWSSSERSASHAWYQTFANGNTVWNGKSNKLDVRPVINYGDVSKPLPILYSDLTTSTEVISGKTPIGVVIDESKKLAVALSSARKVTTDFFDVPDLNNYSSPTEALADWNGKTNTKTFINYCKTNSKSCPAAEYTYSFITKGTSTGDWYLPALGELNALYTNKDAINEALTKVNGIPLEENQWHWSSSKSSDRGSFWQQLFNGGPIRENIAISDLVRPIINYGDVSKPLPILYSDLTTSTEVISGKKPIGVVFDEEKKLAVGLNEMTSVSWTKSAVDIPDLPNFTTVDSAKTDWNGRNNTSAINSYCSANSKSCPAAEYGRDYYGRYGLYPSNGVTVSTNGYWYIPSGAEWNAIYQNKDQINAVIEKLGSSATKLNGWYWTSTEANASAAWAMLIASGTLHHSSPYKGDSLSVRAVISYGEIGQCNYPYSTSNCRYKLSGNFCGSPAKYESCTTVQNCGQYSLGNCVGCISGYTLKSGICEKNQKVCTQCITYGNSCSSAITSKYGAGFCIVHPTITQKPSSCKTVVTVITDPCEGAYCYVCKN